MSFSCVCCLLMLMMASSYCQPTDMQKWENVAFQRNCSMSSRYEDGYHTNCSRAVNGNSGTAYGYDNCIHTAFEDKTPSWMVDLGQEYTVEWITIFGREEGQLFRMTNIQVLVDAVAVYTYPSITPTDAKKEIRVSSMTNGSSLPVKGRRVTLLRTITAGDTKDGGDILLNICEVEVWVCRPGYYGADCGACRSECSNTPCDDIGHPNTCPAYSLCNPNPCQHDGSCQPDVNSNSHTCLCLAGYTGANCENNIDDCSPPPCQHGTCTDGVNSYTCNCDNTGYTGTHCDTDIDECHLGPNPCGGHGACENFNGSYACNCADGYNGTTSCEDINECQLNHTICNNGTCSNVDGSYTCQCSNGFTGHSCDEMPDASKQSSNIGVITGVSISVLAVAVIVVVVVVFIIRRRRNGLPRKSERTNSGEGSGEAHVKADGTFSLVHDFHQKHTPEKTDAKSKVAVKPQKRNPYANTPAAESDDEERSREDGQADPDDAQSTIHLYRNVSQTAPSLTPSQNLKTTDNSLDRKSKKEAAVAKPALPVKSMYSLESFAESGGNGHVYQNVVSAAAKSTNPDKKYSNEKEVKKERKSTSKEKSPAEMQSTKEQTKIRAVEQEGMEEEEDIYSHEDMYALYTPVNKSAASLLDSFQKNLLNRLKTTELLTGEFEEFPNGMPHQHDIGILPQNNRKNRFQMLCAYDKNRVILKRPKGDLDTDYINASWIRGVGNDKAYIATQGPKMNSIGDLWWMVWQENVTQIVMLTNCKEEGKDKCDQYWPDAGNTVTYGHMTVKSESEDPRADFILRTFVVHVKGDKEQQRTVYQYHYTVWPDHGVPDASSLVNFWSYVTARANAKAPPIIHCSAGVGRTGTYIALDIAINQKSSGHDVKVFNIVMELREQRSIMVQTVVQYKFLHEVILEAYTSRNSRLKAKQLDNRFPATIDIKKPNTTIDDEFKLLKEIKQWAKPNHTTAQLQDNKDKNRDSNVLPVNDHLAYLTVHVRGRNQYINAVYMSSFRVRRGLLLTQLPLPDTLVDIWRLVDGCDVNTIVSLGGKNDEKTVKKFCRYWPRHPEEEVTSDPFVLILKSLLQVNPNVMVYSVLMKHKDKSRPVKIIHYTDWSEELPGRVSDLLYLIDAVREANDESRAPVVIQCLDGATRGGLFCVMYDVISRMTQDDEIQIFPTVRQVQCIRREAVASEVSFPN